ncbi:OmpA family protein [Jonesiaceae bacterium BS-20]|uniref:OmpA family protein n=1 Tax=Jonesiaceae bacterium BS-20 TaxID=3120821 RepID=A0AAU7DYE2_9MICO
MGTAAATGVDNEGNPIDGAPGEIPMLGTFSYDYFGKASGVPIIGAVHSVQRLENGTGVYYSVGVPSDQGATEFRSGYLNPSTMPYKPNHAAHVALVDSANLTAYRLLATERGLVTDARYLTVPANALSVLYAVFPALPKDVSVVDLQFAFGSTATAIPVTDAPLGPQVAQEFTMLGQGWPAFPSADVIALANPTAATFDLASRSQEVSGATETEHFAHEVEVSLNADFFFVPGSAELNPDAQERISQLGALLRAQGTGEVTIVGHTDSVPDPTLGNEQLSKDRAAAVGKVLTDALGPSANISTSGVADKEPVASNATDTGKVKNHRVTTTHQGKES